MNTVPIVVATFNAVHHLRRCVQTLSERTLHPYHLYIADDCSPDADLHAFLDTLVSTQPDTTVLKLRTRRGFAGINNWAVAQIPPSEYVCLLNSDIEPLEGWLIAMVEELASDPLVGIVGARLLYPDTKELPWRLTIQHAGVARNKDGYPYHPYRGELADFAPAAERRELNAVTAACVLVRRAAWDQLSGFDLGYVGGQFEDVDFCWRARKAGWKVVYQPKATLYHYEHGSGEEWVVQSSPRNCARLRRIWAEVESDEYLFPGSIL